MAGVVSAAPLTSLVLLVAPVAPCVYIFNRAGVGSSALVCFFCVS